MPLKFDNEQFAQIIETIKPEQPKKKGINFDRLLNILQFISIIASGFWILFIYLSFQKKSDDLALNLAILNSKEKQADVALKEMQLKNSRSVSLSFDDSMSVKKIKDFNGEWAKYKVIFYAKAYNKTKLKLEVKKNFIECCMKLNLPDDEPYPRFYRAEGIPTSIYYTGTDNGKWNTYYAEIHASDSNAINKKEIAYLRNIKEKNYYYDQGGLTGVYIPEIDSRKFSYTFYVVAQKKATIAITSSLNVFVDDSNAQYNEFKQAIRVSKNLEEL